MANSITALQNQSNLKVWRKCEIKRRLTSVQYEADWLDVTDYVVQFPASINYELDSKSPFVYRRGNCDISFRNDEKQFAAQNFSGSLFRNAITRYKTLFKLTTGLEDENSVQYPSSSNVFLGLFSDEISENETVANFNVNDIAQVLAEFPMSNVAPSIVGVALTSAQILGTIRDYVANSLTILAPYLSAATWFLSNTAYTYNVLTTSSIENKSALDMITELALAENHVFYIDQDGNLRFSDRTFATTSSYNFHGPNEKNVNIISINSYDEGFKNIFTKFTCELYGDEKLVSTQEAYSLNSSSDLYGQREYTFANSYVNTTTAASICSDLLTQFTVKKKEIDLTTKYITQLKIQDRVTVKYHGIIGGDNALWGIALWNNNLWSDYKGGLDINADFGIIGITLDMDNFTTNFRLREV